MTPIFELSVAGTNINPKAGPRILSIRVTDERGLESDTVEITVDDTDPKERVAFPATGAKISVKLGYEETGMVLTGEYTVDAFTHSGAPDQLTIRGKAATQTVNSGLKIRKTDSWHDTTLGAVLSAVASSSGLQPAISPALAGIAVKSLHQGNESDQHFCTRLAKQHKAFFKVAQGKLIFAESGKSQTVSGKPLPGVTIKRSDGDGHTFEHPERPEHEGTQAAYHDTATGKTKTAETGKGNKKTLRKTYKSKEDAQAAVDSDQSKTEQAAKNLTLALALARPDIQAETPLTVTGFHPQIDGGGWVVKSVTTELGDGGLIQSVQAERPL